MQLYECMATNTILNNIYLATPFQKAYRTRNDTKSLYNCGHSMLSYQSQIKQKQAF